MTGQHRAPALRMRVGWLACVVAGLLCGCATATRVKPGGRRSGDGIGEAIVRELDGSWEANYFSAAVDLNGDGRDEVVAMVAGPMVCGTGGCPVFVFTPDAAGYRVLARISVAQTPVWVSPRRTRGWHNLLIGVAGGGMPARVSELEFDGITYPLNPTVPPAKPATDLDGAEVLIREFRSYKDGRPLLGNR